jgi:antitoxin MazE
MTTKIQKWGNSLAVRIPNEFAENLNLQAGSTVSFKQSEDKIIITPSRPVYTLEELVKGITKKNRHKLVWPDDKPRGKEVW